MNEILLHDEQTGTDKLTNNGCDICFDNVNFSYKDGENILHNVSFTAKQGEDTALVGPSGGGKTTVSRLAAAGRTRRALQKRRYLYRHG